MTIFTMGFSFLKPGVMSAYVDLGPVGECAEQNGGGKKHRQKSDKTAKLLHLSLFSSCSHLVQQMNNSLDLLQPAKLAQCRQCTII